MIRKIVLTLLCVGAITLLGLWLNQEFCNGPASTQVVLPRAPASTAAWDSACARGDTLTTGRLIGGCYICENSKDRLIPNIDTLQVITIERISETAVSVHLPNEDRQYERCVKTDCKGIK